MDKNILLVEDEKIVATAEARFLSSNGYKVIVADNAKEAIEIVYKGNIDLILMDINLESSMDGIQLAEMILKEYDIPVVFISSYTEKIIVEQIDRTTSYGYVVKGSGNAVLLASVRMAFKLHKAYKELKDKDEAIKLKDKTIASNINPIAIADSQGDITYVNQSFSVLWGFTDNKDIIGRPLSRFCQLSDENNSFDKDLKKKGNFTGEIMAVARDGTTFEVMISAFLISANESTQSLLISFQDISKTKKTEISLKEHKELLDLSLKEKDILLKELQHRVKNNLNVIHTLLGLEMNRLPDENSIQVFNNARSRIISMSKIYEHLYKSPEYNTINLRLYAEEFIKSLCSLYAIDVSDIILINRINEIKLDLKRAVPLGLILNEMITNALKYAFPEGKKGRINIDLDETDNIVKLSVSDDGIGLSEGFDANDSKNLGFTLMKMLAGELQGSLIIDKANSIGTCISLEFSY